MSCKCAKFDEDDGRYSCSVSGSECVYMFPDSKACAAQFGEGPDVEMLNDELADTNSILEEPLEMDCLGCNSGENNKCANCTVEWNKLNDAIERG